MKINKTKITFSALFFIFLIIQTTYSQTQLGNDIFGGVGFEESGSAVAISGNGNRIAVGSPEYSYSVFFDVGRVKIFEIQNNEWVQIGSEIVGETESEAAGNSITFSQDGNVVAIGMPFNTNQNGTNSGRCKVYEFINGDWSQKGTDLIGDSPSDAMGYTVSISDDGNRLALGGYLNNNTNGDNAGQTKVFEFNNGDWTQIGQSIYGESEDDLSGQFIDLSGNGSRLAISATHNSGNDPNGNKVGHVRIFELDENNNTWIQLGEDLNGEENLNQYGTSVSLSFDGNILAIGTPRFGDSGAMEIFIGYAQVFEFADNNWNQLGQNIKGETRDDFFGNSVALTSDGTRIVIGAPLNDISGLTASGYVKVFDFMNEEWVQVGSTITADQNDSRLGFSVSISTDGNRFIAGGPRYSQDLLSYNGIAKVFEFEPTSINNFNVSHKFIISPNPTSGVFSIKNELIQNLNVFNQTGHLLQQFKNNGTNQFDISQLNPGIYFVQIELNGVTFWEKIIKI